MDDENQKLKRENVIFIQPLGGVLSIKPEVSKPRPLHRCAAKLINNN